MFVVLRLQIPSDQLCDASTRAGAEGHSMSPRLVHGDLGNVVLATAQYRAQVEEGDSAEEFDVNDFTVPLVWVSDTDRVQGGWEEESVSQ